MDVRCEKCFTVYEFDDAKVSDAGVTVKCTQCGHLFKVKRRSTVELESAPRTPAYTAPAQAQTPPPTPPDALASPPPTAAGWMIRNATTGEVHHFRELTTLQAWIVERKVTRDDEISRTGENWKRLGGIAELASFFHVVEQAAAVARADGPEAAAAAAQAAYARPRRDASSDDPALTATAQMQQPSLGVGPAHTAGPFAMGSPVDGGEPAFTSTGPRPRVTPPPFGVIDEDTDDLDHVPRRGGRTIAVVLGVLALVGVAGYLYKYQRESLARLLAPEGARGEEAYRQGREYFLLDSDDAFHQASAQFERAHGADASNAVALAGLAEVNSTWAWYLRDDARTLELARAGRAGAAAAQTLRESAQHHLDDAKRYAGEAMALKPDAPEVNLAMADFLRVDGAPGGEAERYLRRALARRPDDPEALFVVGALLYREGHLDEARGKLEQANQLNAKATQHGLLRAHFLLAKIAAAAGRTAEARQAAQTILAANGQHERARTLLAALESDGGAGQVAAAPTPPVATPPVATPPEVAMPAIPARAPTGAASPQATPTAAAAPSTTSGKAPVAAADDAHPATKADDARPAVEGAATNRTGGADDYGKLVAQADRLSENGRTAQALRLYERALAVQPRGIEAITGLGYCALDTEHFEAAVGRFKEALAVSPNYGEALIGLAEAYKVRGDKPHALEYYRRYLRDNPSGSKAPMARSNLRDLEPQKESAEPKTEPDKTETPLPRVAPVDEPPP